MPFDGVTTSLLVNELNSLLSEGKIRKVYQPENDEIRLKINKGKNNYTLLISANPNNSRIHLTNTQKENPLNAPVFCMSLRKHLTNAKILGITQNKTDRVIKIIVSAYDELGVEGTKELICEITGRNANIILTEKGKIIDSLKKVGSGKSRFRQILPGVDYISPPTGEKISFDKLDKNILLERMENSNKEAEKFLVSELLGISPALAREAVFRSRIDSSISVKDLNPGEKDRLINSLIYLFEHFNEAKPRIFLKNDDLLDFYPLELTYLKAQERSYNSYSDMLEDFYRLRDKKMHFNTRSANLKKQLERLEKKSVKKLQNLHLDLQKSKKNDQNKLYADLITANIWQLKKGLKEAELLDYTKDPPELIKVPLKVNESPSQNAQRFYKKYNKNKRAQEQLSSQLKKTREELDYIQSLLSSISLSTEIEELKEISYEFNHSFLADRRKTRKIQKPKPSKPMHFKSSEGFDIYVGKNNYQNDYITTRLGTDEDCWLHVKDAPGSHVLIVADGRFIPEQTVLEAGNLAAYYSSMKDSENVAVDYMEHKFVKKPKHAKPGMVIFTQHNTMYVTPDKNLAQKLLIENN